MVKPACAEPITMQSPVQDCRQPQARGDVPQVLVTHSELMAPPARTTHTWPAAHVELDGFAQSTVAHAPVVTVHRGMALMLETQDAIVRPAPAQSS
jgi:hypothetical protein